MKYPLHQYWLTSLLFGSCVLAAFWVGWTLTQMNHTAAPVQPPPPSKGSVSSLKAVDEFTLPAQERYEAFVNKPLFLEGRTPLPPEETDTETGSTETVQSTPPTFQLIGILDTPDSGQLILLRSRDGSKHYRLKPGEELEGWRLSQVTTDHVVLEQGAREHTLKLIKPHDKITSPPSQPTPKPRRPNPFKRFKPASKKGKKP